MSQIERHPYNRIFTFLTNKKLTTGSLVLTSVGQAEQERLKSAGQSNIIAEFVANAPEPKYVGAVAAGIVFTRIMGSAYRLNEERKAKRRERARTKFPFAQSTLADRLRGYAYVGVPTVGAVAIETVGLQGSPATATLATLVNLGGAAWLRYQANKMANE